MAATLAAARMQVMTHPDKHIVELHRATMNADHLIEMLGYTVMAKPTLSEPLSVRLDDTESIRVRVDS